MNYKKMGIIGTLCAMAALAPQKAKSDYIITEPIYTTGSVVYETVPTTVIQQPVIYPAPVYNNAAYYDGYYDAMNRRWWYNNSWCYRRPPVCRPRYNRCGNYGYRPHFNRCVPAPRFNHCAPVRPHFNRCAPVRMNHCAPRGFHHGPRGGRHCR